MHARVTVIIVPNGPQCLLQAPRCQHNTQATWLDSIPTPQHLAHTDEAIHQHQLCPFTPKGAELILVAATNISDQPNASDPLTR
jgi:hypothetical protein